MSWLPTLHQQTSLMFRTENNLLFSSDGLQRNEISDSLSGQQQPNSLRKGFIGTSAQAGSMLSKNKHKTSLTNMTPTSSLHMPPHHNNSQSEEQQPSSAAGGTSCRNCNLEKRKRSITQTAFQNAIKMTQYLMKEIERLQ